MVISFEPPALAAHGRELEDDAAGHAPSCSLCQPAAPDEVSTAVAASFTAWATGLEQMLAHSIAQRAAGGMAVATTAAALEESDVEAATVISSYGQARPSSAVPVLPTGPGQLPSLPAAPAVPAAPTPMPAETWSALIHGGPGSEPLRTLATQFRTLATELDKQAGDTKRAAHGVDANWNEGNQPAGRNISEHASWLADAANYARTLASSAESAANTVDNTRTATPTPETFKTLRQEYRTALQKFTSSAGVISEPLVVAKSNISTAQAQAVAAQTNYALAANTDTVSVPAPPPAPPPIVGNTPGTGKDDAVQALDHEMPLSPADDLPRTPSDDPPHGKDPRYWLDAGKLIHVPEGELAPSGYVEVGPGLWHPDPHPGFTATPPPAPSKFPLDAADIAVVEPDALGPYGSQLIAQTPDAWYFAPDPSGSTPQPPWPTPQQPIDIRDVINVPRGTLAPAGYVEYLPEWWVPGPQLTNTPDRAR